MNVNVGRTNSYITKLGINIKPEYAIASAVIKSLTITKLISLEWASEVVVRQITLVVFVTGLFVALNFRLLTYFVCVLLLNANENDQKRPP